MAQLKTNYFGDARRSWQTALILDSTLHIPFGTTPALRFKGWTGPGAIFFRTTDSSQYNWTGFNWLRQLNVKDTVSLLATQHGIKSKVDSITRTPGIDSFYYWKNGVSYAVKDSAGGSAINNANAGAFYRWLKPSTQEIKTLAVGYGVLADSTSNTDAITVRADTGVLASKDFTNNSYAPTSGSVNYIQNQFAASQTAQAWVNKIKGDTLIAGTFVTNPATYANGQVWYNSTDGKIKGVQGGAVFNLVDNSISGRTILVDKDNLNATDTRTGLSKYNQDYPWKTINAALATVVAGDNVLITGGTYSERVTQSFSNGITIVIQNATILSWVYSNVGMSITGIGNANIDTVWYGNGAVYSNLSNIKCFLGSGQNNAVARNIYNMDSVTCSGASSFYNINNIRTVRVGADTKFYNCRIVATTGAGIAIRSTSGVITDINKVAFVECVIEASTYAFDLQSLGTMVKIVDSEIYGGTNAIFGGAAGGTRTAQVRAINVIMRSSSGNNTISAGNANCTLNLELSNTTRSGGTAALGTVNYLLQNNDVVYTTL